MLFESYKIVPREPFLIPDNINLAIDFFLNYYYYYFLGGAVSSPEWTINLTNELDPENYIF